MKSKAIKNFFIDRKSKLTVLFFYILNKIVCRLYYPNIKMSGLENIPKTGSFLLIANHTSRWDGPIVMETIKRAANWMVSPNELKGLQGLVLRSVGSFPASSQPELMTFVCAQIKKGEPIVIFPEGNIFRDGTTHPFKNGAARVILAAHELGVDLPVVSVAIDYQQRSTVNVAVAKPIKLADRLQGRVGPSELVRSLTLALHAKLSAERCSLQNLTGAKLLLNQKVPATSAIYDTQRQLRAS